ncbi:MAG: hypothetical protein GY913_04340 [Proteobacteria bacterium]|nr:hypothetical protein [Pseudomonadota bacterium]MCP4916130.1 hypothetical protein [Pseudomonadota bacterium]
MLRALLLLLTATLLMAGSWAALSEPASSDCCPSTVAAWDASDESDSDTTDCCDVDFGACCASSGLAIVAPPSDAEGPTPAFDLESSTPPRAALYRTRATGPPPTPPPIA